MAAQDPRVFPLPKSRASGIKYNEEIYVRLTFQISFCLKGQCRQNCVHIGQQTNATPQGNLEK
jgi:hypothetical protein